MIADGANETDIREELAAPLLSALGYERGTNNDILRELTISYGKNFLGRKKKNDPLLRGRADYVLSVAGAGRWVLEIKAPNEEITRDVIEQAITYARHPEVSGSYAAITNGKRWVLMHNSQASYDPPMLDLDIDSLESLVEKLRGILSPEAIRRDLSPPIVDLRRPLAAGFRSRANVKGGLIRYSHFVWHSNFDLPHQARAELDKISKILSGYRASITGGCVWRDDMSRIRAKLSWSVPHDAAMEFANDKQIMDAEYVSLDDVISNNPERPTIFDVIGDFTVRDGEAIFDILRWDTRIAQIETSMTYRGQAAGYINGGNFVGSFQAEYECNFPSLPLDLRINMYGLGEFEVYLDPKWAESAAAPERQLGSGEHPIC